MKGECPKGFVPSSYVYVVEGGLIFANLMILMSAQYSAIKRYEFVLSDLQYYCSFRLYTYVLFYSSSVVLRRPWRRWYDL